MPKIVPPLHTADSSAHCPCSRVICHSYIRPPNVLRTQVHAASSSIVISQVYGGGGNAGATFTHDFIELFNSEQRARIYCGLVASVH